MSTGGVPEYATLKVARTLQAVLGSGFTPCPNKVWQSNLQQSTKIVYIALCNYFQMSERRGETCVWPSHAEIAACTNIGERTVRDALAELEQCHMLVRSRHGRGHANEYELVDEDDWTMGVLDNAAKTAVQERRKLPDSENGENCRSRTAKTAVQERRKLPGLSGHNKDNQYQRSKTEKNNTNRSTPPPPSAGADGDAAPQPNTQTTRRTGATSKPRQMELFAGSTLEITGSETPEQRGAKLFLRRVLKMQVDVEPTTLKKWTRWTKRKVSGPGGLDAFERFVAESEVNESWLLTVAEDGKLWRDRVGCEWYAKLWDAFVNRPSTTAPRSLPHTRGPGRRGEVESDPAKVIYRELHCVGCERLVGQEHEDDCDLVDRYGVEAVGPTVTAQTCDRLWVHENIRKPAASRRREVNGRD